MEKYVTEMYIEKRLVETTFRWNSLLQHSTKWQIINITSQIKKAYDCIVFVEIRGAYDWFMLQCHSWL